MPKGKPTNGHRSPGAGRRPLGDEAAEQRSVRLQPHHWKMLGDGNVSASLRDTLDRLTIAVRNEEIYLQSLFVTGEQAALLDACNGWLIDTASIAHIAIEVADALPGGLAEKWGIDGPALVEKIDQLGYFSAWVMADAITRWWNRVGAGEDMQPEHLFVAYGDSNIVKRIDTLEE